MDEKDIEQLIAKSGGTISFDTVAKKHGASLSVDRLAETMGGQENKAISNILNKVSKLKDGKDGKSVDAEYIIREILKRLPQPQTIDEEAIEERILAKVPKTMEAEPVPKEKSLDYAFKEIRAVKDSMRNVFKNLSHQSSNQTTSFGGEVTKLTQLADDVKITNPSNSQALVYSSATGKWVNGTSISGDNFSYETVATGVTITVPTYQQMIVQGKMNLYGTLVLDGNLVII